MEDTSKTITSSLKRFFSGTLLSRMTGLGREVFMAAAFGTVPAVAAFWMAFRFAHLLRRLFGEGGLHVAFIPHFESLRKQDPKRAALFFHQLGMGLTFLLLALTLFSEAILASFVIWGNLSPGNEEVIRLTMILLPAIIFICLYALNQSLLNCEQFYFLPSAAPAVFNCLWIGAVIMLWNTPVDKAMEKLAMILVFAFGAQWLVTVPQIYRYLSNGLGPRWWECKEKIGREMVGLLHPFLLGLIGVAATQVNNGLDALFARAADAEGPAILWYALRLQQLPLALLGVGMTGALLPPISRALQEADKEKYLHLMGFALKRTVTFMIPLSVGILVLGYSGVNLVYGHGEFTVGAITKTTRCLWAYGAGLLPMTCVFIFASAFYARKNYRVPTFLSILSVVINCGLNVFFVFGLKMGTLSIALATTVAACVNAAFLGWMLEKKEGLPFRTLGISFAKIVVCSLLAAGVTVMISSFVLHDQTLAWLLNRPLPEFSRSITMQLTIFCGSAAVYGVCIFLFAFLLKVEELLEILPKLASNRRA